MHEIYSPLPLTGLAGHLIYVGLLKPEVARQIQYQANQEDISFINFVVKNKNLTSNVIAQSCAKNLGLTLLDLNNSSYAAPID